MINDGARLFYTNSIQSNNFLDSSFYISTDEQLSHLKKFNKFIISKLKILNYNDYKVIYSVDSKSKKIINIRIGFKENDENKINEFTKIINNIIKLEEFTDLNITHGTYEGNVVLQVGTSKKESAILCAGKFIGIPKDSMLRIGDSGDINGNDYSMLNCQQGYSVNKTSGKSGVCHQVIDKKGNVLKGVNAIIYLINHAKILPTICLESIEKSNYTKNYALIEKDIIHKRKKYLQKYNETINCIFDLENGISDLFDMSSGSIKIPMYEWELIEDDNPLKILWSSSVDESFEYTLRDDNNYLLRGSKTYYYFFYHKYFY